MTAIIRALKWVFTFFNLLEPDVSETILSISKISMWVTLGLLIWVAVHNPSSPELATALAGQVIATGSYAFRRWVQAKTKTGAYADPS